MTAIAIAAQAYAVLSGAQRRLLDSPRRDLVFGVWAFLGIGFVVVGSILDGGLESPLLWLFPLGTVFCALVHPPQLVDRPGHRDRPRLPRRRRAGRRLRPQAGDGAAPARLPRRRRRPQRRRAPPPGGRTTARRPSSPIAIRSPVSSTTASSTSACSSSSTPPARNDETVSVVLVDLDRFKEVNDRHGHLVGDAALRAVANTLRLTARGADVVARVGGEEFAVVLRGTDGGGALAFAERTRREHRVLVDPVPITVSIGVSCSYGGDSTADELFDAADRAMYRAKGAGRNRVSCAV